MASSSSQAGPSKKSKKARPTKSRNIAHPSSELPGVQKIKSALRQTKRLLTKENLAADTRVEAERKLKSLEVDLAKAERTRKERQYAIKYHKVKFFERQKICRKVKQLKKELEDPAASKEGLETTRNLLNERRIDLNYILHYPKTQKYISLFPPELLDQPQETTLKTDSRREELRQLVRAAMEKGDMDHEPEQTMEHRPYGKSYAKNWETIEDDSKLKKEGKRNGTHSKVTKGVPGDAFFDASDDDED